MTMEMYEQARAWAAAGEIDEACEVFRRRVQESGDPVFAAAAAGGFGTTVEEVRAWLERCAALLAEEYDDIPAFYTEMNGFEINTDRWVASLEAWSAPITSFDDLDDGPMDFPLHYDHDLVLTGWESMQAAFAGSPDSPAADDAILLVNAVYLRLVRDALRAGPIPGLTVPVAVTTHATEIGTVVLPG
jgi:hypothetical protein